MFFSGRVPPLLLFFQRVVIMAFFLPRRAMRQSFSFSLVPPFFGFARGTAVLTRRFSGSATPNAELIR